MSVHHDPRRWEDRDRRQRNGASNPLLERGTQLILCLCALGDLL